MSDWPLAELAVLFAAIAYVADRILDGLGWSRSSKTLRTENEDLIRRNKELGSDVSRLASEVARLEADVQRLQGVVSDLEARDQKAVLAAISEHERNAVSRGERTIAVLSEIRDAVQATERS